MGSSSSPSRATISPQPPPPDRPGRHQNLAIARLSGTPRTSISFRLLTAQGSWGCLTRQSIEIYELWTQSGGVTLRFRRSILLAHLLRRYRGLTSLISRSDDGTALFRYSGSRVQMSL